MEKIRATYKGTFGDFGALLRAHKKASHSRKHKPSVMKFEVDKLANVSELLDELIHKTYRIGSYKKFYVYEPKKREIQFLPYRDKVVEHVLCDEILNPFFQRRVIYDNCGCVIGKGWYFAIKRVRHHLRQMLIEREGRLNKDREIYCLKCDIKKYFPSMSHDVIRRGIGERIADKDIRDLFDMFVDSYATPDKYLEDNNIPRLSCNRGVPIGNQISQVLGYFFLDPMDKYIKERLRIKHYIRYMDDFIIFHHSKERLEEILSSIKKGLSGSLQLELNEKTQIVKVDKSIKFLGINFFIKRSTNSCVGTDSGGGYRIITRIQRRVIDKVKSFVKYANENPADVMIEHDYYRSAFSSYNGFFKRTSSYGKYHQIINTLDKDVHDVIFSKKERPRYSQMRRYLLTNFS
ncbi:MAG: RNA-directed DNA polymerase [Christensenellaceae bacterium]|jgi:hypothetical protein|nr:RNA-directed DNA polymerase [Christensenellaceae bacterium]